MILKPMEITQQARVAAPKVDDDELLIDNNLNGKDRILFDRDEVIEAMRSVRQQILDRACQITARYGSVLHNPGDMIDHLIKELEAGRELEPQEEI